MKGNSQTLKHRVITMLNRQELEFLDKLGKDSLFSTGHKLSYNEILKDLVDFAMQMGLTAEKVDSLETLTRRMNELMKEHLKDEVEKLNQKKDL